MTHELESPNKAASRPAKASNPRWWAAGVLALAVAGGAWWFIHTRKPNVEVDPFDDVLDYALLTDAFNSLPVEERLKYLKQTIAKFKGAGSGDSALIASFAAGIEGTARDQLMKNIVKLGTDILDRHAIGYEKAKTKEEKDKLLDQAVVDLVKLGEDLNGDAKPKTDEERLAEAQRQAKRDESTLRNMDVETRSRVAGAMLGFMMGNVSDKMPPQQRARTGTLMRDMTVRLRGQ